MAGMDTGGRKSVTKLIVYLLLFTWFVNTAPYFYRNFMISSILKTDKIYEKEAMPEYGKQVIFVDVSMIDQVFTNSMEQNCQHSRKK